MGAELETTQKTVRYSYFLFILLNNVFTFELEPEFEDLNTHNINHLLYENLPYILKGDAFKWTCWTPSIKYFCSDQLE